MAIEAFPKHKHTRLFMPQEIPVYFQQKDDHCLFHHFTNNPALQIASINWLKALAGSGLVVPSAVSLAEGMRIRLISLLLTASRI